MVMMTIRQVRLMILALITKTCSKYERKDS